MLSNAYSYTFMASLITTYKFKYPQLGTLLPTQMSTGVGVVPRVCLLVVIVSFLETTSSLGLPNAKSLSRAPV